MCKLFAAHILGSPFGAATSRWDVAQRPVSAAASVGAGRLPLADSTRGGSRVAGAVRRLRGQAASLTGRSRGYHLAEGAFSVCTRPGKAGQSPCFPSFFSGYRPLRSRARSKLFEKKLHQKTLRSLRSAPPALVPPLTSSCWPASCAAPWRGCPCACGCSWGSLPPARPRR